MPIVLLIIACIVAVGWSLHRPDSYDVVASVPVKGSSVVETPGDREVRQNRDREARRLLTAKIEAAIDRLAGEGISRDALRDHFEDEIAEALKDEGACGTEDEQAEDPEIRGR